MYLSYRIETALHWPKYQWNWKTPTSTSRTCYIMSWNPICLSVRLSVKRVDWDKTEGKSVQIFVPYERTFSLVFWKEEWLVGATYNQLICYEITTMSLVAAFHWKIVQYYLLTLSSFYFPDHCNCYLFSLVTPVYSLHVWTALFCWF